MPACSPDHDENPSRCAPVDTGVGVRAGQLLGAASAGSELAVHSFVIAVADLAGGAVVATTDVGDMERLAGEARSVVVASILG